MDEFKIIKAYESGKSVPEIAEEYSTYSVKIYRILKSITFKLELRAKLSLLPYLMVVASILHKARILAIQPKKIYQRIVLKLGQICQKKIKKNLEHKLKKDGMPYLKTRYTKGKGRPGSFETGGY